VTAIVPRTYALRNRALVPKESAQAQGRPIVYVLTDALHVDAVTGVVAALRQRDRRGNIRAARLDSAQLIYAGSVN